MSGPRRFDKTQLRASGAGRRICRDYAAHFFRWGFTRKFIDPTKSVLDIGCGQDFPLIRILTHRKITRPRVYVGVDLNKIPKKSKIAWTTTLDEFNFIDDWPRLRHIEVVGEKDYDVIICFEVVEHMGVEDAKELLLGAKTLLKPSSKGGLFFLSTPVNDGKHSPKNHIHEFTVEELTNLLGEVGLKVVKRYGTFGSWPVMKKVITPEQRELCEQLAEYYSWDVISCFLAPLYPDHSRNNIWILEKEG